MNWKSYSGLTNTHAFLSPSKHHWLNYTDEKLLESYKNHKRIVLGTRLHALASELIELARMQPPTADSFNAFVNDAIGYGMASEVILYYSPRCYGTADAIKFENKVLRIHDLKTGNAPGSMKQLLIYAALFCLDYEIDPLEISEIFLRIYQNEEIIEMNPEPKDVFEVGRRIVYLDKLVEEAEELVVL